MGNLKSIRSFIPGILWACVIIFVCGDKPVEEGLLDWMGYLHLDKIGHFCLYFIFCITLLFGFSKWTGGYHNVKRSHIITSLLICIFYGIGIELFQHYFTENRKYEIMDMLANTLGAVAGYLVYQKVAPKLFSS